MEDRIKNRVTLRVEKIDTLNLVESIMKSGKFGSRNEIFNMALEIGLPALYDKTFDIKAKTQENAPNEVKYLAGIKNIVGQQQISLNMLEYLVTILYNIEAAKAEGIQITTEYLESGCLEQLPDSLAKIKQEMIRLEVNRKKRQE